MVKVITPAVWWVWTNRIEPRAIGSWSGIGSIPIHIDHWVLTKSVVEYHIDNDGNATAVARIDKLLEFFWGTVIFI